MSPQEAAAGSASPQIREMRVHAVRVPLAQPHQTASGGISESPLVLADVTTEGGVTGHSITFTYTAAALKPVADLMANLAPLVEGQPLAPAALEQKLAARFRLLGTQGLVGMALAGIDMALWDAHARTHGTSLVTLLGGAARPIQAYGAVGYDGVAGSACSAEAWANLGFHGVKAKIGYPSVREDIEVIRAIRHAVGADVSIMVDYNQSLSPVDAMERIRLLDAEGLTWVEEPVMAHDYRGHALVAREAMTPIQSGENWWGARDLQHALEAGASDYVMFDVMKIGGVTGWLRCAALAEAAGMRVSNHLWPEISAQLLCLTPGAHWLEYADWWNPLLAESLRVERGIALVDGVRGTGVEWNLRNVERYAA
jgi:mandelate racemase